MQNYQIIPKPDCDREVLLGERKFSAYSSKKMKELYPEKNYTIIGVAKKNNQKEAIGELSIGTEVFRVSASGEHSTLLYKKLAYVCVGQDTYICILESRVAFLVCISLLLCGLLASGIVLTNVLLPDSPSVVAPLNPLPSPDENALPLPGNPTPNLGDTDGGFVSMHYTLNVTADLSDGTMEIYFQNPAASNHDVVLQLYVETEQGERLLIGNSGRIISGKGLYVMSLKTDKAVLSEGLYKGAYKVIYYNSKTGERALVESDITDVKITVQN